MACHLGRSASHPFPLHLNPKFRYKAAGANATDEKGNLDTVEFINVSKDDALAWPSTVHRTYPSTVNARMENTIKPFVQKSLEVNNTLLAIFNDMLGLPKGTLLKVHAREENSGSEARCIKNPPPTDPAAETKAALGAHTDFGSLVRSSFFWHAYATVDSDSQSFLHNRLGGLQVMVPGTEEWQYIKVGQCRYLSRAA